MQAEPYAVLFHNCLELETFSTWWTKAVVIPIFKRGKRRHPPSYRPTSLPGSPCKFPGSMFKSAILSCPQDNNLFSAHQRGFIPGRSCITRMFCLADNLMQAFHDGMVLKTIVITSAKAFGRVAYISTLYKSSLMAFLVSYKTLSVVPIPLQSSAAGICSWSYLYPLLK